MNKLIAFYRQYDHFCSALFFAGGFVFDLLTLGRIDEWGNITQQGLYLLLVTALLYKMLQFGEAAPYRAGVKEFFWRYRVEIVHFLLGSLLSSYTIFYFKSASLGLSFLFLALIVILLLLNEWKGFVELGLMAKFSLLGMCWFSYLAYLLPTLFGFLSVWFVYVAIAMVVGLFWGGYQLAQKRFEVNQRVAFRESFMPVVLAMACVALLNFANAIPPVPMSVTYMGVFHKLERNPPDYYLYYTRSKWKFWQNGDQTFLKRPGDQIIFFASIFSPGRFKDDIFIKWQIKDRRGDWQVSDKIPLRITGGREQGFRGYTVKKNFTAGAWRALVESSDGREVGYLNFEVIDDLSESERVYHQVTR